MTGERPVADDQGLDGAALGLQAAYHLDEPIGLFPGVRAPTKMSVAAADVAGPDRGWYCDGSRPFGIMTAR